MNIEDMKRILLILGLLSFFVPVYSLEGDGTLANGYRGEITENFTFGPNTVYIAGEIAVKTYTLTIAPGTTLVISDGVEFRVYDGGSISALGTQSSPILFRARNLTWGRIRFMTNTVGSEFQYCTFENGRSTSSYPAGGAIRIYNSPNISLTNCNFLSNIAVDYGTVSADGGAIYASSTTGLIIADCSFINNSAQEGGAILLYDVDCVITGSTFEGNSATKSDGRAGAIFVHAGFAYNILIDRCKIYSNSTPDRTGGIHFDTGSGGTVQNCLIYSNTSTIGGGVSMGNNDAITDGTVNILNCVIAENIPCDVTFRTSVGFSVRNSIMWGSDASVSYIPGHGGGAPLASNLINCAIQGATDRIGAQIDIEATFEDSFTLNSLNSAVDGPNFIDPIVHDYSIAFISPCRDKGTLMGIPSTPLADYLGKLRVGDSDIGAYEVQYSRWIGTTDDLWTTEANWDKSLNPSAGTGDIVITGGCTNYPTGLNSQNFIIGASNHMIIEPGAKVTLNNLTNNGSLFIGSSGYNNSGSLILTGESIGGGLVTYERALPEDGADPLWHYVASPINSTDVNSLKSFYPWDEVAGDWGGTTEVIESGKGYTVTANGSISFTGSLNSSELNILATSPYSNSFDGSDYSGRELKAGREYGGGGWNLLGNPYASALNVNGFIEANYNTIWSLSNFDPNYVALYLYNGSTYQYVTKDESGWQTNWPNGAYLEAECLQAGQGFFVLAMHDGVNFKFLPSMQQHMVDAALLKSSKPNERWPGIALKARNANTESRTVIMFNSDMSVGLDPSYDLGHMSSGADLEVYTKLIADNGVNFARQALPENGAVKLVIPVGLDLYSGGTVTLSADIEPFRNYKFLLEDRVKGIFTDLETSSYTVSLPVNTNGDGRFYIRIVAGRSTRQPVSLNSQHGLRIWASLNWQVNISGPTGDKASCEVYDARGHKIFEKKLSEGDYNYFNLTEKIRGMYIIKVKDDERITIKKVYFQ
jgi:hypothetical protein